MALDSPVFLGRCPGHVPLALVAVPLHGPFLLLGSAPSPSLLPCPAQLTRWLLSRGLPTSLRWATWHLLA